MKVRRAKEADLPAIVGLIREYYEQSPYLSAVPMSVDSVTVLTKLLLGDAGIVQVGEIDDGIVGVIIAVMYPFPFNNSHTIATEIVVHAPLGWTKALRAKMEQVAKQRGATFVSRDEINSMKEL